MHHGLFGCRHPDPANQPGPCCRVPYGRVCLGLLCAVLLACGGSGGGVTSKVPELSVSGGAGQQGGAAGSITMTAGEELLLRPAGRATAPPLQLGGANVLRVRSSAVRASSLTSTTFAAVDIQDDAVFLVDEEVTLEVAGDVHLHGDVLTVRGTNGAPAGKLRIVAEGHIVVDGRVDLSGEDGANGQAIELEGRLGISVRGPLLAHGGSATVGDGGNGATIRLVAAEGTVRVSGRLDASGGTARRPDDGGTGGSILIEAAEDVRIDTEGLIGVGGDGTGVSGTRNGGAGATVTLTSGSHLSVDAPLQVNGGGGRDSGGAGGSLTLTVTGASDAVGLVVTSGPATADGGFGSSQGGDGGAITLVCDSDIENKARITCNGGDAATDGAGGTTQFQPGDAANGADVFFNDGQVRAQPGGMNIVEGTLRGTGSILPLPSP